MPPLYYPLSALVNAIFGLFFGSVILLRNPKNPLNITYTLFAYTLALWSLCYFFWQISDNADSALFWTRALMAAAIYIPAFYFHFALVFLKKEKKLKLVIITLYTIITIFLFINFTRLFVSHVEPLLFFPYWPIAGPLYGPFMGGWLALALYSSFLLYRKYQEEKSNHELRQQLRLIALGMAFSFIGGATNLFLWWRIPIPPFGNIFSSAYVALTGYAILRYRFLDIRLILARTVTYLTLITVFAVIYINGFLFLADYLAQSVSKQTRDILSTLLVLFIAFTFYPLKNKIQRYTDRFFFQSLPNEDDFLREMGEIVAHTLDIRLLTKTVVEKLISALKVERGAFLTCNSRWEVMYSHGLEQELEYKPLKSTLLKLKQRLTLVDDIPNRAVREVLRKQYISIILRFVNKDKVIGFLFLGDKKSGTSYFSQEIRLLELVVPTIAVALNNTLQFQEIQQFSETLKEKVRQATEKLKEANTKLVSLDKQKDEFLNVAAHELRAPLTAVKGYLSMILDGDAGKVPKTLSEFLEGAHEGAEREIRLVNNLLNVSRIEEGRLIYQMGMVKLGEVVKSVFEEFKLDAGQKGLDYQLEMPAELQDQVNVDSDRIHEVVANFISNAIKYTDKGKVVVRVGNSGTVTSNKLQVPDKRDGQSEALPVTRHLSPSTSTIRFEVSDTGYGMSPVEKGKLFHKFYRAESSAGKALGTGLGLYITKLLIEKFGGRLGVESEKGKGSLFWFELPLVGKT